MAYHDLKIWPKFFDAIASGDKNFEVRKNDRNFQVNDHIYFKEFNPETQEYTGRSARRKITYILKGDDSSDWIKEGICIFAMKKLPRIGNSQ